MNFSDVEGATLLDPDESVGLKFAHIETRDQLNELEQANIEHGMSWVARRRTGSIFDELFIRRLHKKFFGEVWAWAGEYRQTEKNIGIDPIQIPVQLKLLLDDAKFWAENKIYSPLEAAARFHHRLVQIHPFPNGNGRHGRIATDIMLKDIYHHPPIPWASGNDLNSDLERRKCYIDSLRAADAGKLNKLLDFMATEISHEKNSEL